MTNFIFKSSRRLTKNIDNQLEVILNEQRQQRSDLAEIKFMLHKLVNNATLQETVDKFYKEQPGEPYPDTRDSD